MVGHDQYILKITTMLHSCNQVDSTTCTDLKYFENKDFVELITLAQKHVLLNIGLVTESFEFETAVHNSKPLQVLKGCILVLDVREV